MEEVAGNSIKSTTRDMSFGCLLIALDSLRLFECLKVFVTHTISTVLTTVLFRSFGQVLREKLEYVMDFVKAAIYGDVKAGETDSHEECDGSHKVGFGAM